MKKLNVLGVEYNIEFREITADPNLGGCDGYVDTSIKLIVVADLKQEQGSKSDLETYKRKVLRHEIIHAFLHESGLDSNSNCLDMGWAVNEEMIDWFAIQMPKLVAAFKEAGAL